MRKDHLLAPMFAVDVVGNEVHRAGPIQGVQGDEVFKAIRLCLHQRVLHAARFELEHCRGVRRLENAVVGFLVVEGDGIDVEGFRILDSGFGLRACFSATTSRIRNPDSCILDVPHRPVYDRQRAQAQEVELHQADLPPRHPCRTGSPYFRCLRRNTAGRSR